MKSKWTIVGFQSRDYDDARNSDGGQGVKSAIDEMEESPYCTTLHAFTRERYKKKIKHVLDVILVMNRSNFSTELRFSSHRGDPPPSLLNNNFW